ncbi:portal protein [Idiomarinaceae phage Phi1M2-2]|uniref:portal protein n=1 Tax=Idiomarinaceae phage Phi1M2-2 TaxID=1527515 RepID=UPI0004F74969|nr:portal protein [Idiomarinaceae phage Phi1M2-2]AIM40763.1 putative structural protein [Idiomarinaceae phage Phi1M2-2]
MSTIQTHPDYALNADEFITIEDCLEGEQAVKRKGFRYLPHPSQVDKDSPENQARYREYKAGAEYENAADKTRRTMLGKMRLADTTVKLPEGIEYLENDIDGDGTALVAAIEESISQTLPFKFQLLVADYSGLHDLPLDELSIADLERANPRAKVVQYTRQNIVDWRFDRVNGQMQLIFLRLREYRDPLNIASTEYEASLTDTYIELALDESGNYYQVKEVNGERSEPNYVKSGGQNLKWLPVQFVADAPMPKDRLPKQLGFLYSIITKSLHLYIKTAQMDEHQRALCPTNSTRGWTPAKWEQFKEINGRDYIARGGFATNNYPEGVDFTTESPENSLTSYFQKIDDLKKDIRMLGGDNETESAQMTAEEARMVASNQTALLESIAASAERAWRRIITYCAMFEGLISPEQVESEIEDFVLDLPRDFSKPKLSTDEVRVLMEMRMNRDISQAEFHRQIKNGGWLISEVDAMQDELESEPSGMSLPEFIGESDDNLTRQGESD